ncbi:hypothetical protein OsJ_13915 [Oryza sativa Japonica Group]|uniref:Uncharacterized protein n=1 Tax=Oryza sativa subsp. japonica TaxID=39947 RepID=A3ARB6_ORYSJ|nr:hypothetical protein OsJ_13915 [Oryza sativa Japonica Group]
MPDANVFSSFWIVSLIVEPFPCGNSMKDIGLQILRLVDPFVAATSTADHVNFCGLTAGAVYTSLVIIQIELHRKHGHIIVFSGRLGEHGCGEAASAGKSGAASAEESGGGGGQTRLRMGRGGADDSAPLGLVVIGGSGHGPHRRRWRRGWPLRRRQWRGGDGSSGCDGAGEAGGEGAEREEAERPGGEGV